ncbi:MAG: MBL fold metallo-hydrolase [Calditrichaeota bacterium]|nr:MBL fold metallo-hydrolase [Calditrichota bacterium]
MEGKAEHHTDKGFRNYPVVQSSSGEYLFTGDTAYSPTIFNMIGNLFHSFDLAMLPIGTYGNRKYGVNNHLNPEEALKVGLDIKADVFVGMHWGTIELSDEPPWEPPIRFRNAASKYGINQQRIWIMKTGETRLLPNSRRDGS